MRNYYGFFSFEYKQVMLCLCAYSSYRFFYVGTRTRKNKVVKTLSRFPSNRTSLYDKIDVPFSFRVIKKKFCNEFENVQCIICVRNLKKAMRSLNCKFHVSYCIRINFDCLIQIKPKKYLVNLIQNESHLEHAVISEA